MNGKKAKALRALAREATVGAPEARLLKHRQTGQIKNDPNSTRGAERALKKVAQREARRA